MSVVVPLVDSPIASLTRGDCNPAADRSALPARDTTKVELPVPRAKTRGTEAGGLGSF